MSDFRPKFVIASHVGTEHKAPPRLIKSLIACGVPQADILVVVGGAESERNTRKNGFQYAYVTHNSYDHTGLIYLLESRQTYPWWWALHDTTEAGPKFYQNILQVGPTHPHVATSKEGWCNMGLFSIEFLNEIRNYVLSLKNCSKLRAILSERIYPRMTHSGGYCPNYGFGAIGHRDIYGDKVIRRVLYYNDLDLYKYQGFYLENKTTIEYLRGQEIQRKFALEKAR